jgi:hypothetical protein
MALILRWCHLEVLLPRAKDLDKSYSITVTLSLFKITVLYGSETWVLKIRIGDV